VHASHADPTPDEFRVLIAGGGVGGLEAILALRELSPQLEIELLSPAAHYVLTPLSVAEPFGSGPAPHLPIEEFCAEHNVEWTRAELAEVWTRQRRALTDDGTELPYDALMLCLGARRRNVIPDAISYRDAAQSDALEETIGEARKAGGTVAFVVPDGPTWPLPLYELALLAAGKLAGSKARVELRTPESSPLQIMGETASARIGEILEQAGVELQLETGPPAAGARIADWVVSLPTLDVPEIPGIPQGSHGFITTDTRMRVEGTERVWAVGDATWFPAKQGGLAAQQADVAATDVAATAGLDVEVRSFAPVLRAALLTPDGPYYIRTGTPDADGEQRAPLWWPPAKVAGRLLAPYLARRVDPGVAEGALEDMGTDPDREEDHREALDLALIGADLDAEAGEFKRALHWLEIAEGLNLVVPEEYREKQRRWQKELDSGGAA
jgi:sulfide:quinone oxidoreductase